MTQQGMRRGVGIKTMCTVTKVYALAALDICTKSREELHRLGALKAREGL